jgi:hypothetical protein
MRLIANYTGRLHAANAMAWAWACAGHTVSMSRVRLARQGYIYIAYAWED